MPLRLWCGICLGGILMMWWCLVTCVCLVLPPQAADDIVAQPCFATSYALLPSTCNLADIFYLLGRTVGGYHSPAVVVFPDSPFTDILHVTCDGDYCWHFITTATNAFGIFRRKHRITYSDLMKCLAQWPIPVVVPIQRVTPFLCRNATAFVLARAIFSGIYFDHVIRVPETMMTAC